MVMPNALLEGAAQKRHGDMNPKDRKVAFLKQLIHCGTVTLKPGSKPPVLELTVPKEAGY